MTKVFIVWANVNISGRSVAEVRTQIRGTFVRNVPGQPCLTLST